MVIKNLTCNYLKDPLGVETPKPRLSWMLCSDGRDEYQIAYRIIVASNMENLDNDNGDLWDSGKVESDQSILIPYDGMHLSSGQECYWKVCVWDQDGNQSPWSQPGYWGMGLLRDRDWQGKWIALHPYPVNMVGVKDEWPAPMLRRSFALDKAIKKARVYISGLGYYELYINGEKVGDQVLAPGFTRYDKTVLYQTFDVTHAVQKGENAVGVILGNGWYNCSTQEVWLFKQAPWRSHPKLLFQMHIEYEDGGQQVIVSDTNWLGTTGPIVYDSLRNGETYDARLEIEGWTEPGFNDQDWERVKITRPPGGILKSQQMTPIRVTQTITPISVKEVKPGVWVYDLGQNISGWAKIRVSGDAGSEIVLRYSENLGEDGDIDTSNIDIFVKSGEFQTDRYILKGQGIEEWEPRFTYHGFRYVQMTGFKGVPTLDNLQGRVVHTDFETRGEFQCSNELFNTIQKCSRWSTLTNYHGMPTDCPHREKNGWTGDAALSGEQTILNFHPATAYTKWLKDFIDVQRPNGQLPGIVPTGGWGYNWGSGPAWDSAIILLPWYMYIYYGDTSILEDMYQSMKKYVDYVTTYMANDHIVEFGLGDWCPPRAEGYSHNSCPTVITDTAYYYIDTYILSKAAALLNKEEDAKFYDKLARDIRQAFREKFVDIDAGEVMGNSQTAFACVLYQGIVDGDEASGILKSLEEEIKRYDYHLDCGILGTKYIMHALTEYGRVDLAYAMANQTTYPSWGYWIAQGATTLWEDWEGNSSRNHHMYGDISAWFYKGLAGINPDPEKPGFKHIIIKPNPVGDLKWVKAWHQSMYGKILSHWSLDNDEFSLKVNIPVNTTATVYLPAKDKDDIRINGQDINEAHGIKIIDSKDHRVVISIGSGEYNFTTSI
ncbi:MAG: glycoside hydrolase family 78 protein [Caldicoprobacterales bacterium]